MSTPPDPAQESNGPRHAALGPGGEFDRIRAIWRRLGPRARTSGDDAAVLQLGGERVAISTDLAVEGTHFRPGWLAPREIGWRAAAASLSDLAAMAAGARGVLVSLGVSAEWPPEHVAELMEGVGEVTESVGGTVWGGDLVRSDRLVVDVVAVGSAKAPVRRSDAKPGDALWVTGALGGPAAALAAWLEGAEPERTARERFARPVPRLAEARWLQERGARAMIDVSDGVLADAAHLAAASGVAVVVDADRVPVHPAAEIAAALTGGEEYELLVTLPPQANADVAARFEQAFGLALTRIGRVEPGRGVSLLRGGAPAPLPKGYGHF